jgi:hypothetical protein
VIDLSDVAAASGSYQFNGIDGGDRSGYSVASAGDVDGDGRDDLIVGAYGADGTAGESYFISGADLAALDAASGTDGVIDLSDVAAASGSYQFNGSDGGDYSGISVASAGDVDGDGRDDLIVGAYRADGGAGESYFISGSDLAALDAASGTDGAIDLSDVAAASGSYQFNGIDAGDYSGWSVASAGDVDGDGRDDLIVGRYGADGDAGESYFISGADLAFADDDGTGPDGIIDLSVLFWDGTVAGTSGADVIGATYTADPQLDRVTEGADTIAAGEGDDTILSSGGNDSIDGGAGSDTYRAQSSPKSYQFNGIDANDRSGVSVASAGDVDGDGRADLIVGAYNAAGSAGESYFISGAELAALDAASGTDGVIDLSDVAAASGSYQFNGIDANDRSGYAVASAGDVDGDGRDDLIIGGYNAAGSAGESYFISGADLAALDAASGTDGAIDLSDVAAASGSYQFNGIDGGDRSGYSVASAGDVDGDGRDDLIIGAYGARTNGNVAAGESYFISGANLAALDAASGTDGQIDLSDVAAASGAYQFNGIDANDNSGYSVASAGDVDGDGRADLIIGALGADPNGNSNAGASYFISGADLAALDAASGTDGVIDLSDVAAASGCYQFNGIDTNDFSGISVASAGDVDGDGRDDLIIGARGADAYAGESYFISGADLAALDAASGTDGVIDLSDVAAASGSYQFNGIDTGDSSGLFVASAGDVDGDGRDDLIVGAPFARPNGNPNAGESYFISGADLAALDAASGTDGQIDLSDVAAASGSYQFNGIDGGDRSGYSVASAGDVDGDGRGDLIIGAYGADGDAGESYFISGAELAALDAASGTDGVIDLSDIASLSHSIAIDVDDTGSGTATSSTGSVDTISSVETYIAEEHAGARDQIALTATGASGPWFDQSDVQGLDDNAVGTFTPQNGDPAVAFGPSAAIRLSGILAQNRQGQIQITAGDESGSVGGIAFDNFEEINFGVLCFARGTLIGTIDGERPIEDLRAGDRVLTLDNGEQPIRWIGHRKLSAQALDANPKLRPIRIRAGAFGPASPRQDLVVSPQHRILVRSAIAEQMFGSFEVLIPANKLLPVTGIDIAWDTNGADYWHMLFDTHQIIWSNRILSESLFTGPQALKAISADAREEVRALFPQIAEPDFAPSSARPIPETGKMMKRFVQRHAEGSLTLVASHTDGH